MVHTYTARMYTATQWAEQCRTTEPWAHLWD